MIIGKDKTFLEKLPFEAEYDNLEKTLKINRGFIVECYEHVDRSLRSNLNSGWRNGSKVYRVFSREFSEITKEDMFVLDLNTKDIKRLKRTAPAQQNTILIWSGADKDKQYLKQNVFIQDYEKHRKLGFKYSQEEFLGSGYGEKVFYKINPGFVVAPQSGFVKFIKGHYVEKERGGENETRWRLKVSVSATVSVENKINYADRVYINGFKVEDVVLEEYAEGAMGEDDPVYLSKGGNNLNGTYYVHEFGNGNVHLNFEIRDPEYASIGSRAETQVRGASFYKNGVLYSPVFHDPLLDPPAGHYREVVTRINSEKFRTIGGVTTKTGDYTVTVTQWTEGDDISSNIPYIESDVNIPSLGPDEFVIFVDTDVQPIGQEISQSAYNKTRIIARELPWTNIGEWSGDGTPVFNGAGKWGEERKINQLVIHAERRFKRLGVVVFPHESIDAATLPLSFQWFGGIFYDNENYINLNGGIQRINEFQYSDREYTEIAIAEEGIFGKEIVAGNCGAQEDGGYSDHDVTKLVWDKYQELKMVANPNSVV